MNRCTCLLSHVDSNKCKKMLQFREPYTSTTRYTFLSNSTSVTSDIRDVRHSSAKYYGGTQWPTSFRSTNDILKPNPHSEIGTEYSETQTAFWKQNYKFWVENRILKAERTSESWNRIPKYKPRSEIQTRFWSDHQHITKITCDYGTSNKYSL